MWMSSITSGVKIRLWPSRLCGEGAFSSVISEASSLENELALGRLEVVVVVEVLAADELLERGRFSQLVDREFPVDQLCVGVRPVARHAIDPERFDLAGDVDR